MSKEGYRQREIWTFSKISEIKVFIEFKFGFFLIYQFFASFSIPL